MCLKPETREGGFMLREMFGMAEGILQDLHDDHQEVAQMIDEIIETEDAQQRTALFKAMMTKLAAHLQAEESVLYRKMEKSQDGEVRSFAFEGGNEHEIAEQQMQQMSRARNKASEQWTAQAKVLRELVSHHVEEEESTGFSCARKEFGREQLEKMADQFQRQKEKLMAEV
jgi:hemerythrin-like domain-containing protein